MNFVVPSYIIRVVTYVSFMVISGSDGSEWIRKLISGEPKSEIKETIIPEEAMKIFKDHGVSRKIQNHVCQSIDNKRNTVYGETVCRLAVEKLHLSRVQLERVECEPNMPLFKHIEYKIMAKCFQHKNSIFYLLNGPKEHFYYIVAYSSNNSSYGGPVIDIIACLFIKIEKVIGLNSIKLQETYNPVEADDIFGVYGSITDDNKNICHLNGKGRIRVNDICMRAANTNYIKSLNITIESEPGWCVKRAVARRLLDLKTGYPILTKEYDMAVCKFSLNIYIGSFHILNGRFDNWFYIVHLNAGTRYYTVEAYIQINTLAD